MVVSAKMYISGFRRVMPGDRFSLEAKTYYDAVDDNSENVNGQQLISSVLTSLAGGSLYSGTPLSELPGNMQTLQLTLGNSSALGQFLDQSTETNYDALRPGAYLNYMIFDEQGNLTEQRSSMQIDGPASQWNTLSTSSTIEIGKPGYLLAFTSSRAMSPVWFDGIKVTFYKGTVLEENHYYTLNSHSAGF